ncbi:TonB-dependent siderophore receptor [Limnobaculum parvum]|uniref:TonB-dependent siderophore receptor n=1 Tax=Limnobaculum parvum TaxID=2172103 RepID=A0A2Y9TWD8_9GAMM|nr:TonB-dependent siderophore receptor [Limnobaculum parvum]AWH87936.1 TonB-dependent siderophore receptor [Limnobaculum parvum]
MNNPVAPNSLTYKPLAYAILLSLTAISPAMAEETTAKKAADEHETLLVTGSNTAMKMDTPAAETPRSVSEVTEQDIKERGAKKIDEALRYSAGIQTGQYGADNRTDWLIIRGFEWAPYQNGLPSIYNEAGFYSWHQETYGIERIDALKGPASMLYGQNPPGGLVNIITKHPTRLKQGEIDVAYGSDDYRHFGIDTSGPVNEEGNVLYRFVGFAKKDNGPVDGASSERYYFAPSMSIDFNDKTSLTLLTSYMKDNTNPTSGFKLPYGTLHSTPFGKVDKDTSFGEPSYSKGNSEQFNISYELSHMFNDTWTFKQNGSYSYLNLLLRNVYGSYMLDDRNIQRGLTYRDGSAQNYAIDNRLVGNWTSGRFEDTLLLGTDYSTINSRGTDGNVYSFGSPLDIFNPVYGNYTPVSDDQLFGHHTKRFQTGIYVQNQLKFDDKWLLLLGGRYDKARSSDIISNAGANSNTADSRIDMDDHKYTKSAGLMYLADNGLNPYISYSESFQPLSGRDGNNKPYEPQTGQQTEIGVKYVPAGFNGYFNAAAFEIYQKNILTTSNDPTINYAQIQTGMARSRGLELEAVGYVTDALQLHANYTLNRVETIRSGNSDEIGNRLPLTPLHMASLWADYAFNGKLEGLTIGSGVRYIGSTYGDKTNDKDLKVPAYTLWDAMVRYDINKEWQVQVNASNLTDTNYVSGCNYWCYYGEGRKVTANINYHW